MRKELEIIIYPDGDVKIETLGMTGEVCVREVLPIQEVLGYVKERSLKGEFYKQQAAIGQVEGRTRGGDSHHH